MIVLTCTLAGRAADETATVSQVLDGDTCQLADGRHVRYLGIDAPEKGDPLAEDATQIHNRLVGGKTVRLELGRPNRDRDGRLLAYVFLDKKLINAELVRLGCAHIRRPVSAKYHKLLLEAQDEARAAGHGIWTNAAQVKLFVAKVSARSGPGTTADLNAEFIVLENRGDRALNMTGWTVADEANHRYLVPNFVLPAGGRVTLHTGVGKNTATELFWGSRNPIWNDSGDSIFVKDASGQLVLAHVYPVTD
jgi:endonuclease YncB( thermonuclease family)